MGPTAQTAHGEANGPESTASTKYAMLRDGDFPAGDLLAIRLWQRFFMAATGPSLMPSVRRPPNIDLYHTALSLLAGVKL